MVNLVLSYKLLSQVEIASQIDSPRKNGFLYSTKIVLKKRISQLKACVRYFLSNFYFSPNDSPSKTMKNAFYFI